MTLEHPSTAYRPRTIAPLPGMRFVAQPIVDLRTGDIPAVELLARPVGTPIGSWTLAELAAASPALLRGALDQAAELPDDVGLIHVNVTALDLDDTQMAGEVLRRFRRFDHLVLEVTEQFELRDTRTTRANLRCLRDEGVKVALDDFGDGFASSVMLRTLRPDIVKVTWRGLCGGRGPDPAVACWVREQAADAGATSVVVEQLDHIDKVEWVRSQGFDLGQGRLLDAFLLRRMVAEHAADEARPARSASRRHLRVVA